jgi:hypothetical protein
MARAGFCVTDPLRDRPDYFDLRPHRPAPTAHRPPRVHSLFARASRVDLVPCRLPSGREAALRRLRVRFGRATPEHLKPGALATTYTSKPLVTFRGAPMFGELAVLRWLEVDGWEGVWVDTFHGRKFWRDMPTRSAPVALPPAARSLYDRIVAANGGRASGFFDVMAWRGAQTAFVEYEGPGDRANRNRNAWVDAALSAGVAAADLLVVAATDDDDDGGESDAGGDDDADDDA